MPEPRRVLFLTSNGTGLGHLTRSLAIARRLDGAIEPLFVTFSAAAPVVAELGFPVEYLASYDRPGAGTDLGWTRRSRARLETIVDEARPELVVFDGTHPYERLLPALRSAGAALVWCRRAMWRPDSDTAPLWRTHLFDAVLEPGEYAADADAGPTVARRGEVHAVDPIVLLDRVDLLPRADAERELGLAPGRVNALVQLGQGEGVREANERCLRHLAGRDDVQVAALSSTLAALDRAPGGVVRIEAAYPISRYLAAFDLAVAAAGYNAYHELIHLGVPALYVPMPRRTDDQAARARYAEAEGTGRACEGPDDPTLERKLDDLLDATTRGAVGERLDALEPRNGAVAAARWIEQLVDEPSRVARGAGAGGGGGGPALRLRRWRIFAASVPATVVRIARQILTRPRTRTVVIALGFGDEDLSTPLAAALEQAGERPERALVLTDSLDFAALLALGVGFEQLPASGGRQVALAGGDYERLAAERVRLILAGRPRPRRVVMLGDVPEAVRAAPQPSRR